MDMTGWSGSGGQSHGHSLFTRERRRYTFHIECRRHPFSHNFVAASGHTALSLLQLCGPLTCQPICHDGHVGSRNSYDSTATLRLAKKRKKHDIAMSKGPI